MDSIPDKWNNKCKSGGGRREEEKECWVWGIGAKHQSIGMAGEKMQDWI